MAMLDYAVKVASEPYSVSQTDIDHLLELGFCKEADIGSITSNRQAYERTDAQRRVLRHWSQNMLLAKKTSMSPHLIGIQHLLA